MFVFVYVYIMDGANVVANTYCNRVRVRVNVAVGVGFSVSVSVSVGSVVVVESPLGILVLFLDWVGLGFVVLIHSRCMLGWAVACESGGGGVSGEDIL